LIDAAGDGTGVLWCLVAAVTYAAGVLFQKPTLRRLPAIQVTLLGCVAGAIALLPFTGDLLRDAAVAPAPALWGMVYLGLVPTAIAFTTWAYALSRMPAGQLGVTTYIVPPLVIVFGALFFGEIPALLAIAGGAVCLGGVALSRRRSPARTERAAVVRERAENLPQ
jgi:drug/metabolite transporter (DMT)-like permease